MILQSSEPIELEALLWAWTNINGRMPDANTMTEDEIAQYWEDYGSILERAIRKLTGGLAPDEYARKRVR